MPVVAQDFKTFADALLTSTKEIDLRNYISRSYYHAFHVIRPYSQTLPLPTSLQNERKTGTHEFVIKRLSGDPSSDPKALKLRSLAALLGVIRVNRNAADYDIHDSIDANKHQDDLENVFRKLAECK